MIAELKINAEQVLKRLQKDPKEAQLGIGISYSDIAQIAQGDGLIQQELLTLFFYTSLIDISYTPRELARFLSFY
ncbi:MAG: hypothetical protein HYW01_06355 [Deltaproteobacteria bacterium]|nr:hypothetical protein [Deltaproteobacteria bacterium]